MNVADGAPVPTPDRAPVPAVTVYWRRGCPFCRSLRRGLRRVGLPTLEQDIWSDPEAAAFVRAHAGGNETVPTVVVGGTVLVNPSVRQVVALATDVGIPTDEPDAHWWRRARG